MNNFSVLTLNIWNYTYHWEERLDLILKMIEKENPDVIFLQEVMQTDSENQAGVISKLLGPKYSYIFAPTEKYHGDWTGPAIISKHKIAAHQILELSQDREDSQDNFKRSALFATIENINFINTHLSLSKTARAHNIDEILKMFRDLTGPIVFGGDFNCHTNDPVVRKITESDFQNTYQGTEPTWPVDNDLVLRAYQERYSGKELPYKIVPEHMDNIFVKGLTVQDSKLLSEKLGDIYASDHFGVVARLSKSK